MGELIVGLFGFMCFLFIVYVILLSTRGGGGGSRDTIEVSYRGTGMGVGSVERLLSRQRGE